MTQKLTRLIKRREQLLAQSDIQRRLLAQNMLPWRAPLALADQGMAALGYFRRHPILWAGAALLLALWRPQRAGVWLSRGWLAWRLGRGLLR